MMMEPRMTEPISEQPLPEPPTSPTGGCEFGAQPPITPLPLSQGSGVKWGRGAVLMVLILGGLAWSLGWLEPLADWASPTLCQVTGTVRYNGQPVTKGFVQTIYERRGVMGTLGSINPDGTFELTTNGVSGAYSGRHRVIVLCMDGGFPPKSILPERYTEPRLTPLVINVSRTGPNKVQLELVDVQTP